MEVSFNMAGLVHGKAKKTKWMMQGGVHTVYSSRTMFQSTAGTSDMNGVCHDREVVWDDSTCGPVTLPGRSCKAKPQHCIQFWLGQPPISKESYELIRISCGSTRWCPPSFAEWF